MLRYFSIIYSTDGDVKVIEQMMSERVRVHECACLCACACVCLCVSVHVCVCVCVCGALVEALADILAVDED